jgi:hypothetical protein
MPEAGPETLVCVGGACDGRRVQVSPAMQWVELPVFTALERRHPAAELTPIRGRARYVRLVFQAGGLEIAVLAPPDMPAEEVLHRLVQGYQREG